MTAPRAAPFPTGCHWAPLPGSMTLERADAITADIAAGVAATVVALKHGLTYRRMAEFIERNCRAMVPEAA